MPPNKRLIDDCFAHDGHRLRHDEALAILKQRMAPVAKTQSVSLDAAHGRFLAAPVKAGRPIPSADNSAVDGYAFDSACYEQAGGWFPVVTRIAAGDTAKVQLPPGSAARIFTGATMPEGADTVAMQEDCEAHEQDGTQYVAIPPGLKPGANRRRAGEDVATGEAVAEPGNRLTPQAMAAIASTGAGSVEAYRPLRIALISSGDELLRPGEAGKAAATGQVYDSNHFLLAGLTALLPCKITDLGIVADDYDAVETALSEAAANHDVILTSGGASLGEEDHMVAALDALGKRHLWQLAIKPGRPMLFGQIGDTVFFGLPGNPVACFVCYLNYVHPSLTALAGGKWPIPQRYLLPAQFATAKKPGRREFWRARVSVDADGNPGVEKFRRDGSGLISGLTWSDGLIEVGEDITNVERGEPVNFIPFARFGVG